MLETLSIRNIVLIDELTLDFKKGLCVLTGETGAGKSILLDALGLALGERAEARLLRQGADKAQVTASFSLPLSHPLWKELEEQGISSENKEVIFRRTLDVEGKSKCFLNDQVVSQNLMRQLGQELVEVHGQFDQLLQAKHHLSALDTYGRIDKTSLSIAFKNFQDAKKEMSDFEGKLAKSFERETILRFAIEDLEKAAPKEGEEDELENERSFIAHRAKIAEALDRVDQNIGVVLSNLSQSHKALSRIEDLLPEKIKFLLETTDRALIETQEIFEGINGLKKEVEGTNHSLESLENRLYTLKNLGRKYQTDNLLKTLREFKAEFEALEHGEGHLETLKQAVLRARDDYLEKAQALTKQRKEAAEKLQAALSAELPPLKLERALFRVHFDELSEAEWSSSGIDRVEFYIQTNPGTAEGPLSSIASGGELSRLMLALKVILAQSGAIPTLIFDEIESGTGGAVASAMGERLRKLSENIQVLSITHSPQIASFGTQHLVVFKIVQDGKTTTQVKTLDHQERHEEVARMLSGEEVTEEARAAAKRLIGVN